MLPARWILFGLLIGCHTPATGAHAEEAACLHKCTADGLSMLGMVRMGEHSASCVCEVPRMSGPPALTTTMPAGPSGSVGGAISAGRYQKQPQESPTGTMPQ
jgi:hypothetical protein